MDNPVYITAQEAAERLLTIRIAGYFMLALLLFAAIWLFIAWKYSEDRRREEVENDAARIAVTNNIGKALANSLKDDGNWKEQFLILKAKYDVLEAHCKNLENVMDKATGRNGFGKGERYDKRKERRSQENPQGTGGGTVETEA